MAKAIKKKKAVFIFTKQSKNFSLSFFVNTKEVPRENSPQAALFLT